MNESGTIFIPKGFRFSATTAGIKPSGKPDLGLILAPPGSSSAALFTRNLVVAAPVTVGRGALSRSRGRIRAVVVNSGNANCATGRGGILACQSVCAQTAKLLMVRAWQILPSSTGMIGVALPAEKIRACLPQLIATAGSSPEHLRNFAQAIMTTDKRQKLASVAIGSGCASITGVAKGAGMIHPQLATMLVYLMTDVGAAPSELKSSLGEACSDTFNAISIDGDTSTNDTVMLLASGESRVSLRSVRKQFETALLEVCRSLAEQIVADGEGVEHVIRLRIEEAMTRAEALQVARAVAHSLLVKTAWAGADPNWGRILAAIGRSGIKVDPSGIDILIGDQQVCRNGAACTYAEQLAHEELLKPECRVTARLGRGKASVVLLTADLTEEYVRINAEYST
jgi:glutamate N-acetyltransferase / amino-acid N-acetyltransferase